MRHHLSFANVVSLLALFVALGGTGYAAIVLPEDSVGNRELARNAVRSSNVENGTLVGRDLRPGSVGAREIGSGTIGRQELAPDALPRDGAPGPQGPRGERGPAGPAGPAASINGVAAGGDLAGTYPNPVLAPGSIDSSTLFSAGLVDAAAATASLRTLGTGATQAVAGNDPRLSDARPAADGTVGVAAFGTLPHGKMRQVGACQEFPTNRFENVRFDELQFGFGVTFGPVGGTMTVGITGTYMVMAEIKWDSTQAAGTVGSRSLEVQANGNEIAYDGREAASAVHAGQNVVTLAHLTAGTVLRAVAGQSSGNNALALSGVGGRCASLAIQWIGP